MIRFSPMPPTLETERLVLRRRTVDDAGAHRGLWAERDPRSRHLIVNGHPTVAELREIVAAELDREAATGLALYAIELRAAPGCLGYCGLIVGQASAEEPELAYELRRADHGRGVATEAAGAVIAAARGTGRRRLWATVREWNAASIRVAEKLGFLDSGRRDPDPERGDSVWMRLDL